MLTLPNRAWRKIDRRIKMVRAAAGADAFLVSYPKSGRTWFRFILSYYFARTVSDEEPPDLLRMFQVVPNYDMDRDRGIPAFRYAKRPDDVPLILVTHHAYRRSLFLNRPVVFMVRDPRDVIVSAFFHATRHKHRFTGDLNTFVIDEVQGLPRLLEYLNGWAAALKRHRHAILSYEELTADPIAASERVLRFLQRVPDRAILEEAVAASRFEAMREREMETGLPAHEYDRGDTESLRMRRGKVGGFPDYLTRDQALDIVRLCGERLTPSAKALVSHTGLDLPRERDGMPYAEQPITASRSPY